MGGPVDMHTTLTNLRISLLTSLAKALMIGATATALYACSPAEAPPWTKSEMKELVEYFGEVAEAYALVDICIPMIEADGEAKYQLVSAIEASRYAKIRQFDTQRELTELFDYFRERGGSPQQNLTLRRHYEEAYRQAGEEISSVQVCIDTIKDYANTIINMRVH